MSADKKDYLAVIETVNGIRTAAQFHERLNKIAVSTEDEQLRRVLNPVMQALRNAHNQAMLSKVAGKKFALKFQVEPFAGLVKYCTQLLASQKPTWQILAERHGWRPPGKS
ncbi:hypothetical protein [Pseudoxanthomonas mexicana]|uniref:hypothetical protein n=1 Tax=Pseudoxanthomonas mexicana TaxID=128785 RepID=UPI0020A0B0AF|nr:hypothetical protein [Pseudoxanthomonas mexicana]MCP1584394.1 hypothetical protein [Pseudoxanthomonas mexicana]